AESEAVRPSSLGGDCRWLTGGSAINEVDASSSPATAPMLRQGKTDLRMMRPNLQVCLPPGGYTLSLVAERSPRSSWKPLGGICIIGNCSLAIPTASLEL
ncbi:hypothetical protein PIB30_108383, partial [Stylosanthes scabra]|nr:hypothetical protein [Stylosanthes scabra]